MSSNYHDEAVQRSPTNAWNLYLGRAICSDVQAGLNREWLVTNGLGGYASGSIPGATTRSYHGLLVAALRPPVERTVLVTKIDEELELHDWHLLKLGVNEYHDGTIDPQGYQYLDTVSLEGDIVCFSYQVQDGLKLEKRVWMEYGQNTTYVQYRLWNMHDEETNNAPLTLRLSPFCLFRDHHRTTQGATDWHFLVENLGNSCRVRAYEGAISFQLLAGPTAQFTSTDCGTGAYYIDVTGSVGCLIWMMFTSPASSTCRLPPADAPRLFSALKVICLALADHNTKRP